MRAFVRPLIYSAALAVAALAPWTSVDAQPLKKVNVGYPTATMPIFTSFNTSVPLELFFRQEGLDVNFQRMQGATVAVQALDTGQVDIAVPATSAPLALLSKVPQAGVVAFYTYTSGFQSLPAVLRDSKINDLKLLPGRIIGVQDLANSQVQTTKSLVQLAGGDPSALKFVPVGEGAEAALALQSGRVDALALFDGLYGQIEATGVPLRYLTSDTVNRETMGFSAVLITKASYVRSNRDVLVRYARAVAKGTIFSQENPEAAVRLHWKAYPETKQRSVPENEALKFGVAALKARLENVYKVGGIWGDSTPQQIENYIKLMQSGGVIRADFKPEGFWDPSMLKEINDFDESAIRKMAKEWKP